MRVVYLVILTFVFAATLPLSAGCGETAPTTTDEQSIQQPSPGQTPTVRPVEANPSVSEPRANVPGSQGMSLESGDQLPQEIIDGLLTSLQTGGAIDVILKGGWETTFSRTPEGIRSADLTFERKEGPDGTFIDVDIPLTQPNGGSQQTLRVTFRADSRNEWTIAESQAILTERPNTPTPASALASVPSQPTNATNSGVPRGVLADPTLVILPEEIAQSFGVNQNYPDISPEGLREAGMMVARISEREYLIYAPQCPPRTMAQPSSPSRCGEPGRPHKAVISRMVLLDGKWAPGGAGTLSPHPYSIASPFFFFDPAEVASMIPEGALEVLGNVFEEYDFFEQFNVPSTSPENLSAAGVKVDVFNGLRFAIPWDDQEGKRPIMVSIQPSGSSLRTLIPPSILPNPAQWENSFGFDYPTDGMLPERLLLEMDLWEDFPEPPPTAEELKAMGAMVIKISDTQFIFALPEDDDPEASESQLIAVAQMGDTWRKYGGRRIPNPSLGQ